MCGTQAGWAALPCGRGSHGDAAGEEMRMRDTNLGGARHQWQHGSKLSWGSHPPLPKGLRSPQPHGRVRQFCCSVPHPQKHPCLLCSCPRPLHTLPWSQAQATACRAVLCPGKPAQTWGRTRLMRLSGCCCHSRVWGEGKAADPGCSQVSPGIS